MLITSCTYNTEDRELATVVSHHFSLPPALSPCHLGSPLRLPALSGGRLSPPGAEAAGAGVPPHSWDKAWLQTWTTG